MALPEDKRQAFKECQKELVEATAQLKTKEMELEVAKTMNLIRTPSAIYKLND